MEITNLICKRIENNFAKDFISKHHYSHSCNLGIISYGFYYNDEIASVIVFSRPSGKNLAKSIWEEGTDYNTLELSGGHPEWHLMQDVIPLLEQNWDMIIAFPPCTHLAVSGAAHFKKKIADGRQKQGIDFFMLFTNIKCDKVAIENPIGIMSRLYRKPDQIIQPWQFGDKFQKSTCLWLKGLPLLVPTDIVEPGQFKEWVDKKTGKTKRQPQWFADAFKLPADERAKIRSKTFDGIAKAMAEQWVGAIQK